MPTNLVECINSVWKSARNLSILALVRATYYRLNALFTRKSTEAYQHKRAGYTFFEFATHRIYANMQRAGNIVVHQFDRRNEVFEVRKMPSGKVLVVVFVRRRCDYSHFQVEQLPCHHVIACCVNRQLDWQMYVTDVYKMSEIRKVYIVKFVPLGDMETWPDYSGPTIATNSALRRKSKGRPKSTRYLNEMDSRKMPGPRTDVYAACCDGWTAHDPICRAEIAVGNDKETAETLHKVVLAAEVDAGMADGVDTVVATVVDAEE
ncbi:uncharacterized protein [Arachis hypogaea]|uniref:uncharacterized protein n=1 Tax=Arachis hypogaea TaxID=3818 RepID=UPI003B227DF6